MIQTIASSQSCALKRRLAFNTLFALALMVLISLPQQVHAAVNSVTPAPAVFNLPTNGAGVLNVTWNVVETSPTNGIVTVSSSNALLQVNGTTVATLGSTLSQSQTLALGQVVNLSFNEILTISPGLARQIATAAPGAVTILRSFNDGTGPTSGTVRVATSNAGPLTVRRIELSFENQSRTDIVQRGDTLRAVADVSFRSNGLLRAEWRLVDPVGSLGGGTGRVLQVVRQQLVSSGNGRTRIVSPPLPTKTNGLHLLAFTVEDTDGNIDIPVLQYFVLEGRDNVAPVNLDVLTPGNNASVNGETVFSWNPLQNAQAYQLEVLPTGSESPVTAKLVPGSDLKLSLSSLSLEDLTSGQSYDWRVRAFADGKAIGSSERYSFTVK